MSQEFVGSEDKINTQLNNETIGRLPGFLRGVFLANHLAITVNLTRTTKRQNTYQCKLTIHKRGRGHNKQQHTKNILRYKTERKWFSRLLWNAAGLFPRTHTGHFRCKTQSFTYCYKIVFGLVTLNMTIFFLVLTIYRHERTYCINFIVPVWCRGNALVLINAVALHRVRLVLGWVTAFG